LAEPRHLESRQEVQTLTVLAETVQGLLEGMRETLSGTDAKAKPVLLRKLVAWAKLGRVRGGSLCLPSARCGLYTIPPGGYGVKTRTMEYGSAAVSITR
jgi:hypothetical protein